MLGDTLLKPNQQPPTGVRIQDMAPQNFVAGDEAPLVDGFLYSASMLYLPTTYRASCMAQMEVLRRARGYRTRWYMTPEDVNQPVPANSQIEYQIQTQPGSYLWGASFAARTEVDGETGNDFVHVMVTDNCTETPLFSDYALGANLFSQGGAVPVNTTGRRNPMIFPQSRLIGAPGTLNVEVYNHAAVPMTCQLVLFMAEPSVPSETMLEVLREMGVIS